MNVKNYIDGKGKLIGRDVNGVMLDGKGHNVARFIKSSNRTVDGKGRNVGVGDLRDMALNDDRTKA